jgi:hypothetical protein
VTIAQGARNRISGGGAGINGRYARVYFQVQPLLVDAAGVPLAAPGTIDAAGRYLHVRYRGNLDLNARSGGNQIAQQPGGGPPPIDFVPNYIEVEFDAQSFMTLPFEGQVELVGGLGQYKFGIFVDAYVERQLYVPVHRYLTTFVATGATFTVPDFHTFMLATSPNTVLRDLNTNVDFVPSTVLPGNDVVAGTQYRAAQDTVIKTGWYG